MKSAADTSNSNLNHNDVSKGPPTTTTSGGQQMTYLPEGFVPGEEDVICGRGKKCYNHIGNEKFRERVTKMLDEYSKAKSKLDKSGVLASVVDQIRAASPGGGFVKQDEKGRWYEVGDFLAREKTSQAFRDALHERYKSSNVAKKKRRQEEQAKASDKFRRIARSYSDGIGSRLEWLSLTDDGSGGAGAGFNMGSDPRLGMMRGVRTMDDAAAARLSSLAQMRQRLNRRFGEQQQQQCRSQPSSRPGSAMDNRYADPLFGNGGGHGTDSRIPFPEGTASSYRNQVRSVPTSPMANPYDMSSSTEDIDPMSFQRPSLQYQYSQEEAMHHSMPDLGSATAAEWEGNYAAARRFNPAAMHHSAPDLMFTDGLTDDSMSDLEPIPLTEITPRPASKKSISGADFKKAISMTLSPNSPSAEALSKDLLASLEKLTGQNIKEHNPFDPLPLANAGDSHDEKNNHQDLNNSQESLGDEPSLDAELALQSPPRKPIRRVEGTAPSQGRRMAQGLPFDD